MIEKFKDFIRAFVEAYKNINSGRTLAKNLIDEYKHKVDNIEHAYVTMEEALEDMAESLEQLFSNSKIDKAKAIIKNKDTVFTGAKALSRNKDAREGLKNVYQLKTGKGGINNHEIVQQVRQIGSSIMHPEKIK